MKFFIPFIALACVFLLIKSNGFGIRLSDSNIYFYTAYQILEGKILYKDIFFTNFPLLPYISTMYFLILRGNLSLYYLTPSFEAVGVALLIYIISFKKSKSLLISTLSSSVYLFSFIVLATSDHQTGVFLASLFGVVGYYFLENKNFGKSGIFLGLSLLTKAYFIPLLLASLITVFLRQKKRLLIFLGGLFITVTLVLLPSALFAREEIYTNIVEYSLTRSQGISKLHILRFFIAHDFLLFSLFIYTIFRLKKDIFMGALSISSMLFIIFYKDIYYLYLNFMIPFLAIACTDLYISIHKKFHIQKYILPTVLVVIFVINIAIYISSFQQIQRLTNKDGIVSFLKAQPENVLYGANDITPALAYLSDKTLLNEVIDTNENIYKKGFLNAADMTTDAIKQHALIISHGAFYPQFNVENNLMTGIFDSDQIRSSCIQINSFPVITEGIENRINIFRC